VVDRTDLFKISNLVWGGKEIVTSHSGILEGHRQTVYGEYSELAGSPFFSAKINSLRNFLEQLTL
jgi:thiaminase